MKEPNQGLLLGIKHNKTTVRYQKKDVAKFKAKKKPR
jgi:hypothetical protein